MVGEAHREAIRPIAPIMEFRDAADAASARLYLSASNTSGVQFTMKNTAKELAIYAIQIQRR